MEPAIIGVLGTIVGAVASFAATAFVQWIQWKKERESRREDRAFDYEKWRRDQLQQTLLNATFQLDLYVTIWLKHDKNLAKAQADPETVRLSAEVKKWLLASLLYFPNKTLGEYRELQKLTRKANHTALVLEDEAWAIRQLMISLATSYQTSERYTKQMISTDALPVGAQQAGTV